MSDAIYFVDPVSGDNTRDGKSWTNAWKTVTYALSGAATSAAIATSIAAGDDVILMVLGDLTTTNQGVSTPNPLVVLAAGSPVANGWNPIRIIGTSSPYGGIPDPTSILAPPKWDGTGCDAVFSDGGQTRHHYHFQNIDFYRSSSDAYAGATGYGAMYASASSNYGWIFKNCYFTNHIGWGAVSHAGFDGLFQRCLFTNCNTSNRSISTQGGGAVWAYNFIDCIVTGCKQNGFYMRQLTAPCKAIRCISYLNQSGSNGFAVHASSGTPEQVIIDSCVSYGNGTGILITSSDTTTARVGHQTSISNSIISGNTTYGIRCPETEANKQIRPFMKNVVLYNLSGADLSNVNPIEENTIYGDPMFNNAASGDFTLDLDSAAILANGTILGALSSGLLSTSSSSRRVFPV